MDVSDEHLRAIQKWRNTDRGIDDDCLAALDFITAMDLPEPEWEPSDEMVRALLAHKGWDCHGRNKWHAANELKRLHAAGFEMTLREDK